MESLGELFDWALLPIATGSSLDDLTEKLKVLPIKERVDAINRIRKAIHDASPFKTEPVDMVWWVESSAVRANDYNPNSVAPPEMELLRLSIAEDGYTQPIVSFDEGDSLEVVDGFHRHRVGKECGDIQARIHGYLPVVKINSDRSDKADRIAATIRHNRARGKHKVESMSDIVIELKRRNWSDEKIAKHLGMDADEVLRLCQITGMHDIFSDQEFSKSWDVEGEITESDYEEISEEFVDDMEQARTVNTSDSSRVFHTFDNWECFKAGFYSTRPPHGMTKKDCHEAYAVFLVDIPRFESALSGVINDWKMSCEHYLTNASMNRIAWLGQAAMCYETGVSSEFRSGFSLLSEIEQDLANKSALKFLNIWLKNRGMEEVDMNSAMSGSRQSDIY